MHYPLTRRKALPTLADCALATPHVARTTVRHVKLGHDNLPLTSFGRGSHRLAAAAACHPDLAGVIKIEVCPNAICGDELTMLTKCQGNRLDMMTGASSVAVGLCREIGVFDIPFLFKDVASGRSAFDGSIGDDYAAMLKTKGINVVGWFENGVRHLTSNRAVRRPADLEGLRLRVPQSTVSVAGFTALGARARPLPFNMVYEALRTGQFDAQESPLVGILTTKFYQLQRYLCLTSHNYSVGFVVISPGLQDYLTARQFAALRQCAMQGMLESRVAVDAVAKEGLKFMRQAGMSVIDDVDTASFLKAAQPFVESIAGSLALDRIIRLTKGS